MLRVFVTVALLATLLVFVGGLHAKDETSKIDKPAAPVAPEFALKDTAGKEHRLSDYKGKIVVLEWTCRTCPFVIRHYKSNTMKKLSEKYARKNVVWLAIDSGHSTTAEAMEKWRKQNELVFPVLLDPTGEVGHKYKAAVTPHLFIIQGGKIVYQGGIDDDPRDRKENRINHVEKALEELTSGKPVSMAKTQPYG